ncbi:MAG TPA: 6-phosphogluconolactonase, partial [bacterium]|nr:6-phosphogluconolactonase [bacterium]
LSGGSTPVRLFQQLASPAYRENIDWKNVHFFWGDERCVPPDHPDSNYGMTKKYLFDHISIPHENIHRINGENDPETEAKRYAGEIFRLLPLNRHGWPQFDWILLGLGNDGHTASIFPGSPILKDRDNICAVATHPQIGQKRITLTLLVINATKRLSFLVSGENKASIAANILTAAEKNKSLPATFVRPENGALEWYLDQPAAAKIRGYYES